MQVVEHQHQRAPQRGQRAPDARQPVDQIEAPGPDSASNTSGASGSTRCSAAAMYRRNIRPASSRPSSATHANGRGSASAHRASSVVLPYPAGATTVANGAPDARSRPITSDFGTVPARTYGAASFVSTRANGISAAESPWSRLALERPTFLVTAGLVRGPLFGNDADVDAAGHPRPGADRAGRPDAQADRHMHRRQEPHVAVDLRHSELDAVPLLLHRP